MVRLDQAPEYSHIWATVPHCDEWKRQRQCNHQFGYFMCCNFIASSPFPKETNTSNLGINLSHEIRCKILFLTFSPMAILICAFCNLNSIRLRFIRIIWFSIEPLHALQLASNALRRAVGKKYVLNFMGISFYLV